MCSLAILHIYIRVKKLNKVSIIDISVGSFFIINSLSNYLQDHNLPGMEISGGGRTRTVRIKNNKPGMRAQIINPRN